MPFSSKALGICAGSGQTSDQTILEHIRAAADVLTDDDAGRLVVAVALTQSVVIPAEEATNLVGVVSVSVIPASPRKPSVPKYFLIIVFPHPKSELTNICFSREEISLPATHHGEVAHLSNTAMLMHGIIVSYQETEALYNLQYIRRYKSSHICY